MKTFFFIAALFASVASAQDGDQWSQAAVATAVAVNADGSWRIGTSQMPVVGDAETPVKFRGSSKLKRVADVPLGAIVNVIWCVEKYGACDTRASTALEFGFEPSTAPVEFHVGNKSFPGFK